MRSAQAEGPARAGGPLHAGPCARGGPGGGRDAGRRGDRARPRRRRPRGGARRCPGAEIVVQRERLGTAHAVLAARAAIERGADDVIVAFADTPLVQPRDLRPAQGAAGRGGAVSVLGLRGARPDRLRPPRPRRRPTRRHPRAPGRERGGAGHHACATAGLMALSGEHALAILDRIGNGNAQGEFYLTDAVEVAADMGGRSVAVIGGRGRGAGHQRPRPARRRRGDPAAAAAAGGHGRRARRWSRRRPFS